MTSNSRDHLPAFILWLSIIISAALAGSMVPQAREIPLVIYFMCLTAVYHSGLLASRLSTRSPSSVDPLDGSHMIYTFCLGIFWLFNFVLQINSLKKGPGDDREYFLAIFSCLEWMLNAVIIYLSLMAWRDRQIRGLRQENDLECCSAHRDLDHCEDEVAIVYLSMTAVPTESEPYAQGPDSNPTSMPPLHLRGIPEALNAEVLLRASGILKDLEKQENV